MASPFSPKNKSTLRSDFLNKLGSETKLGFGEDSRKQDEASHKLLKEQLEATLKKLSVQTELCMKKDRAIDLLDQRNVERETEAALTKESSRQEVEASRKEIAAHLATIAALQKRIEVANDRSCRVPVEGLLLQFGFEVHVMFGTMPAEPREAAKFRENMRLNGSIILLETLRRLLRDHIVVCSTSAQSSRDMEIEMAKMAKAAAAEKAEAVESQRKLTAALQCKYDALCAENEGKKRSMTAVQHELELELKRHQHQLSVARLDMQELRTELRNKAKSLQSPPTKGPNSEQEADLAGKLARELEMERQRHKQAMHEQHTYYTKEIQGLRAKIEVLRTQKTKNEVTDVKIVQLEEALKKAKTEVVRSRVNEERAGREKAESLVKRKEETIQRLRADLSKLQHKVTDETHTMERLKDEYASIFEAHLQQQHKSRLAKQKRIMEKIEEKFVGENATENVAILRDKADAAAAELQRAHRKIKKLILHLHYERTRFEQSKAEAQRLINSLQEKLERRARGENSGDELTLSYQLSTYPSPEPFSEEDDEATLSRSASPTSINLAIEDNAVLSLTAGRPRSIAPPVTATPLSERGGGTSQRKKRTPGSFGLIGKVRSHLFGEASLLSPSRRPTTPSIAGKLRPQSATSVRVSRPEQPEGLPAKGADRMSPAPLPLRTILEMAEGGIGAQEEYPTPRGEKPSSKTLKEMIMERDAGDDHDDEWRELIKPEIIEEIRAIERLRESNMEPSMY